MNNGLQATLGLKDTCSQTNGPFATFSPSRDIFAFIPLPNLENTWPLAHLEDLPYTHMSAAYANHEQTPAGFLAQEPLLKVEQKASSGKDFNTQTYLHNRNNLLADLCNRLYL